MGKANLARAAAAERARLIDVTSYDVTLDFGGAGSGDAASFTSRVTATFRCSDTTRSTFVDVIANSLDHASLNGRALDTQGHDTSGAIALTDLEADNTLVVEGEFAFHDTYLGVQRSVDPADGRVYVHSMAALAESQRIFACFDQPDLKARFTFHVTTPRGWAVISNGRVVGTEETPGDTQLVHFEPTPPIPTYIAAVMAGPFHGVTDSVDGPNGAIELGLYSFASAAPFLPAAEIFALTKAGFAFCHATFDYPYPFTKYDQIVGGEARRGGMENAAAVSLGGDFAFRSAVTDADLTELAYVVLHELSHMWFGNLVTPTWWDDTWLNESFATFAGYLMMVEATRWTGAWAEFGYQQKRLALEADQLSTTHPVAGESLDMQTALSNFDQITYAKGACVLKQLVAYVGRDEFDGALRQYFRAHEFANATLSDLLGALQRSSGRDLTAWSHEWLGVAQVNTLRPHYTVDDGTITSFMVAQEAPPSHPTLRTHRIAIGLYSWRDGALQRRRRIETDIDGPRTEVEELVGEAAPDLVIANDDDLTYAKLRFDPRSLETVTQHIGTLTDPVARSVSWLALWDMTRHGELRAADFLDVVSRGIGTETQAGVLASVLKDAEAAAAGYAADPRARLQQLAELAWDGMTDRTSRHQLSWARCFARVAGGSTHAATMHEICTGVRAVDGIEIDLEMHWALVHGLVPHGLIDAAYIDGLLSVDENSETIEHALTARAMVGTASAKAGAWEAITSGSGPSLAHRLALADGFWCRGQEPLLERYAVRYFETLGAIWATDGGGMVAQSITGRLFPRLISTAVLDLANAWLAGPDRPSTQARRVARSRDELARSLHNRALDAAR